MADISLTDIEGDFKKAVADAQDVLDLAVKLEGLIPSTDRKYVTDAQNILTVLESIAAKLSA